MGMYPSTRLSVRFFQPASMQKVYKNQNCCERLIGKEWLTDVSVRIFILQMIKR